MSSAIYSCYNQRGEVVVLEGKGTETIGGTLYNVRGAPHLVAKIYSASKSTPEAHVRLQRMIAYPPPNPTASLNHLSYAWPQNVLYDHQKNFIGYLQFRVLQGYPLSILLDPRARQSHQIFWNFSFQHLVYVGIQLATLFRSLQEGGYVFADLDENLFYVTEQGLVTLVDTEYLRFYDETPAAGSFSTDTRKEYAPPEVFSQLSGGEATASAVPLWGLPQDHFRLAILLFRLLMEGHHPFSGVSPAGEKEIPLEERIVKGLFPFSEEVQRTTGWRPPASAPSYDRLGATLQELFHRAFVIGAREPQQRPTPAEFLSALTELSQPHVPSPAVSEPQASPQPVSSTQQTPASPVPASSAPSSPEKTVATQPSKPSRKVWIWAAVGIVVVGLGAGAFWLFFYDKQTPRRSRSYSRESSSEKVERAAESPLLSSKQEQQPEEIVLSKPGLESDLAPPSEWKIFNKANSSLPYDGISDLEATLDGGVWIGTYGGGLAHYSSKGWRVYNKANSSLPDNRVYCLAKSPRGGVWIGTDGGGLAYFDGYGWEVYNTMNSLLPDNRVHALAVGRDGSVWIGTPKGLAHLDDGEWIVYSTIDSPLPSNDVKALAVSPSGEVWIGTAKGLVSISDGQWRTYSEMKWASYDIQSLAVRSNGEVWVGTWGKGVIQLKYPEWKVHNTQNSLLPGDHIVSIAVDDLEGTVWVGTKESGIACYKNGRWSPIYNAKNSPLPDNHAYALAIARDGSKWVGTWKGIARIP